VKSVNPKPLETALRLDAIIKNLGIGKNWDDQESEKEVILACLEKVNGLIEGIAPHGEAFASRVAKHFQVQFEEVRTKDDIDLLEKIYLHGKREMGFACLRDEIYTPNVDALLFQRTNAKPSDFDRWVAVLNLTVTEDRAYWNRFHELSHRLAEPPQYILPFRRQLTTDSNEVENLIDKIAGHIAFPSQIFMPYIHNLKYSPLTFEDIKNVRNAYAPTASLLAVTNAVVQKCERPALAFVAIMKAKKYNPNGNIDLRIEPHCRNKLARENDLYLFNNMRIPLHSCAYHTFRTGVPTSAIENTRNWTTSDGKAIPEHTVTVSAVRLNERIYGLMTI